MSALLIQNPNLGRLRDVGDVPLWSSKREET